MNVLEVPEDANTRGRRSRSSSVSFAFSSQTLNPHDRFVNPTPTSQALKPRLPRLITPSTLEQPGFNVDSFYAYRHRPWTAVSPEVDMKNMMFPEAQRNIKSASSSPTTVLKSAFDHVLHPVPPSALTPSQGGRGRSRILHGTHDRTERTNDPSIRELRGSEFAPGSGILRLPEEACSVEIPGSPMEMVPNGMPLMPTQRKASPHRFVREAVELSNPPDTVDVLAVSRDLRVRGRSPSSTDRRRSSGIHQHQRHSNDWTSRRSASLGRSRREPSPLRNVLLHSYDQDQLNSRIPEGITEAENEDPMSPRRAYQDVIGSKRQPRTTPLDVQTKAVNEARPASRTESLVSPATAETEKELPPLPAYLLPEPLFSTRQPKMEDFDTAIRAMNDAFEPDSRFSVWSTPSDVTDLDHPESPSTEHVEFSPTFSSIKDSESGACSPHRLSGLILDAALPQTYPQGVGFTSLDSEYCLLERENEAAEVDLDGRTPTATSFASGHPAPGTLVSQPLNSLQADQPKHFDRPIGQTPREKLLRDFDYLGDAVV